MLACCERFILDLQNGYVHLRAMSTRFLHTADWQLGKSFAGIADVQKRSLVQQERFTAIQRLGSVAAEHPAVDAVEPCEPRRPANCANTFSRRLDDRHQQPGASGNRPRDRRLLTSIRFDDADVRRTAGDLPLGQKRPQRGLNNPTAIGLDAKGANSRQNQRLFLHALWPAQQR